MRLRQGATALALAAGSIAVTAPAAEAHYVYDSGYPYATDRACTWVRAEVSHGAYDSGYFKADTESDWNILQADCQGSMNRPAGYISARIQVYKWNGTSWALCTQLPTRYNSGTANKLVTSRTYALTPCGPGSYRAGSVGYVYNGAWNGGRVVTDTWHNLYD